MTPPRQRGIAAIEFAACLIILFMLLPPLLMFARIFLYYHVLYQASRDAAHYMASVPATEMLQLGTRIAARDNARQIILDAAGRARLATAVPATSIAVNCDAAACDQVATRPALIRISWSVAAPNDVLAGFLVDFHGGQPYTLNFDTTVVYAN